MPNQADRAALLVMDVQPGIIDRAPDPAAYLARVTEAVRAARSHAVPVIHVVVGFRPGMPEVSARNQAFSGARSGALRISPTRGRRLLRKAPTWS